MKSISEVRNVGIVDCKECGIASNGMIFLPCFMNISPFVQKLLVAKSHWGADIFAELIQTSVFSYKIRKGI